MSNIAIKAENLSKAYQLGQIGTGTLSRDLERWFARLRGKEDPFLRIGEANDRTINGSSDIVWSLKDINFEIQQGDAVGIIGRNGAGKSTLLKILSKVTSPTTGKISGKGRIASLLEVGTGFHPELTGRENIFLNGAILGMRKKEINMKFDEIVDFAGIERYIDTPVKRYSSGMYVRLAFAVAAHLESEILIVDEVLAVGDAEFQKKCLGKMGDVSKGEGRTVLFVSHNMSAVQKFCKYGLLMTNGMIHCWGSIDSVVNKYLDSNETSKALYEFPKPDNINDLVGFANYLQVEDDEENPINEIPIGRDWQVRIGFTLTKSVSHFIIGIGITNSADINIRTAWSDEATFEPGEYVAIFKEDLLMLSSGTYYLNLGLSSYEKNIQYLENAAAIIISDTLDSSVAKSVVRTSGVGLCLNPMKIEITRLEKPHVSNPF